MPRSGRIVIPDLPHHVTHRGNNQKAIFLQHDDYSAYISLLKRHCSRFGLGILGWCLMPNHVHLVVVPASEESLGLVIGKVHGHFTQYANRTRGTSGHLWENRFYSCPMDETHVLCALRYVDRNPVRAGLFEHARDYEWSSALAHVSGRDEFGLIRMARWEELLGSSGIDWSRYVEKVDEEREIKELKAHTARGIFLSRGQAPGFAAAE